MNTKPPPLAMPDQRFLGIKKDTWIIIGIGLILLAALLLGIFLAFGKSGEGSVTSVGTESSSVNNSPSVESAENTKEGNSNSQSEDSGHKEDVNNQAKQDTGTTPDDSAKSPSEVQSKADKERDESEMTPEEIQKYSAPSGVSEGLMLNSGTGGFFGIRPKGNHIVFVVDKSSSMSGGKIQRALKELQESISELAETQKFSVYFFSDSVEYDKHFIKKNPSSAKQKQLKEWLNEIYVTGGTNPLPAMRMALIEKCDEIFLLSDGEFSYGTADSIRRDNKSKTRINTISLGGSSGSLKKIAEENNGQYIEPSAN
jgi:hypothetical protein